jgi:hypothetical protein
MLHNFNLAKPRLAKQLDGPKLNKNKDKSLVKQWHLVCQCFFLAIAGEQK